MLLCRNLDLLTDATVAIDGSKFKAVNNRDKNFTSHKLQARLQQLDDSIARYLIELDRADRTPDLVMPERIDHIKEKMASVKEQLRQLKQIGERMAQAEDGQLSLTDPDARSMATSGRGTGIVGYNVQVAVDTTHHLIVAHEVTNDGHDRGQLFSMAQRAREAIDQPHLTALADRGYFKSEEILACDQAGINALVPKSQTSGNKAAGLFDKADFLYLPATDEYRCPAGERAICRFTTVEKGMTIHKYWSSACPTCSMKHQCTAGPYRRITRWEHEAVIDAMQARLNKMPHAMKIRRQTVEHTFGTLKSWMGATHFSMKTLPRVQTEMSLHVLAYNMKRMIQVMGVESLITVMKAR